MYGFLLTRRWLGFALCVVLLTAICLRAGMWQMDKHDARVVDNAVARENLLADPVPLDDVVAPGEDVADDAEWSTVQVTGTYDPEHELTVKFSTRDGAPGVDVVTPLLLADGTAILVDRGWMQTANNNERPEDIQAPPQGEVDVVGWLRPDSEAGERAVTPYDGQVRAVSAATVSETVPQDLRSGYLELQEQTGGTGDLRPEPVPDLGQGPHFFYALQWWFFGLLAVIGFLWFAWSEARDRREARKGVAT
ncbi:SURF1 family protein [Aeromicrobium sp. CTD01-1L150]|uniref:SURF1 family cytochrome oxidase biogenesis protein n=1 Tax=Aeromicrobium sp. CTD01-1L150 TaxID=3341830 RepID=UPI0035BED248